MKELVSYFGFRFITLLVGLMPFALFYRLSDGLAQLFWLTGYRKKVIKANLHGSFPDKSGEELNALMRAFYVHFSDIVLEGIKSFSMSKEELVRRYKVQNPEVLKAYVDAGKSILLVGAHYANWEWGTAAVANNYPNVVGIYSPVSNKRIERMAVASRAAYGMKLCAINETAATFKQVRQHGKPTAFVMICDQSPSGSTIDKAIWLPFLNRHTPWLHGMEKYGREMGFPVAYFSPRRVARGHYEVKVIPLNNKPQTTAPGAITEQYVRLLESIIYKQPAHWLWSHQRWKRARTLKYK